MSDPKILEEAAEWLVTLRDGGGDAAERSEFAAWISKSPEHVRAYLELSTVWTDAASVDSQRRLDVAALLATAEQDSNVVTLEGRGAAEPTAEATVNSRKARSFGWPQRIAACVAIVCVATAITWWQSNSALTYTTGIGEQRLLTLSDGSRVELNARSRIRIRFSERERLVELLEGQGMFQVAKNPQRPFIVSSDHTRVRAVGTQFDVYRRPSGTVVTVLEGKVEVQTGAAGAVERSNDSVSALGAGQQVIVVADRINHPAAANVAAATAWTQRQLVFDSATLAEVAHEFNRYNLRQLVIRDAELEGFLISGVFSSTEPASLLNFLQQQADFLVQETDTEIRISRRE
ncbi:FecR family protein [Steroidobacter sp.]|uniref:FecR family protein n=1 Tax=Steroidobacter sp. TaxID=1978227 RepID=UPI001A522DBD|nr:FecR family protein [Steroidobacter sp.]MBL8271688.1 FecR family protein [Steroidobacter sp.]